MKLVIVESPTKAKTIQRFLSGDFLVKSSLGHIRDLPKGKLGIDVENDFTPQYVIPRLKSKIVTALKKDLSKASVLVLATDEDREGEAIAWHISQAISLNKSKDKNKNLKTERIVFHEITKSAIEEALKNPREIDMDLVDAQQARRILDRLVGYKLSPFLWYKIAKGLSAGRVQSVAVRLIVEREREIQNFKPQEHWSIEALLAKNPKPKNQKPNKYQFQNSNAQNEFTATLIKKDDALIGKLDIKTQKEADKILEDLEDAEYRVESIEKKGTKKNPLPPFQTSTLQQTAWQKLKYPARFTMGLAQQLYENGLITYHRTDSLNLSEQSLKSAQNFIVQNFGQKYYAGSPRKFKTKSKGAQEAHEAIRPTDPQNIPEKLSANLDKKQLKLYDLIWRRFLASQMSQAIFDSTAVDIAAKNYIFRANGSIMKFDGFLKIYHIKFSENELPPLEKNEILNLL